MNIRYQSEITFKGNSVVKFYDNDSAYGIECAAMYVYSSTVIFKEYCKVLFNNNINNGAQTFADQYTLANRTAI